MINLICSTCGKKTTKEFASDLPDWAYCRGNTPTCGDVCYTCEPHHTCEETRKVTQPTLTEWLENNGYRPTYKRLNEYYETFYKKG